MQQPGTSVGFLVAAVIDVCWDELAEVRLPSKTLSEAAVNVIEGYIDPNSYADYDWPALLVRASGGVQEVGESGSEEQAVDVDLLLGSYIGTYGDDSFAISVLERLRIRLLSQRTIDGKYRLKLPLTWSVPEESEQPWPYWVARISAKYFLPAVAETSADVMSLL